MQEITKNLNEIYRALNTISPTGHQQCKTYTNCMDALLYTIGLTTQKENEQTKQDDNIIVEEDTE